SEALEAGLAAIKPGVQASDVDRTVRSALANHGLQCRHHIGHGVGVTYHEEPYITPYNNIVLKPGMVIALEPGAYLDDLGVRLEDMVIVTEDGYDVLST